MLYWVKLHYIIIKKKMVVISISKHHLYKQSLVLP